MEPRARNGCNAMLHAQRLLTIEADSSLVFYYIHLFHCTETLTRMTSTTASRPRRRMISLLFFACFLYLAYATNAQTNTRAAVKRRDPPPPQPAAFPIPMKRKQTQSQNKRVNARDAIPMQPVKAPAEKRVIRPVETGKA